MFNLNSKKGISSVIATSLLIIVAVASIISFQTWFSSYSSSLYVQSEDTSSGSLDTRVERVIGSTVYFNNGYRNISVTEVRINGISCNVSQTITNLGIESLDATSCLNGTAIGAKEVSIYTNKGIFTSNFIYDGVVSSLSEESDEGGSGGAPSSTDTFISTWNTSLTGTSSNTQITLPLVSSGTYNFNVSGSNLVGSPIEITSYTDNILNFTAPGVHEIEITGEIDGWSFNSQYDSEKIVEISQWGPLRLGTNGDYFEDTTNLQITAQDLLNTTGMTSFLRAFDGASSITTIPGIGYWDMSSVTNFNSMFAFATNFNQDLSMWNTSSANFMNFVFLQADSFNGSINSWDVSGVTTMMQMFSNADNFNQPLDNWNTSSVTSMAQMFSTASSFNQPLNSWDTSSVTSMNRMFIQASSFNQDLNNWTTTGVLDMDSMFYGTSSFNGSINSWDTSSVGNMDQMFQLASSFNQPLDNWDTSSVTSMDQMFSDAISFDQDLRSWCVTNIASEPSFFATNSPLNTNGQKPVWGTCP